MKIDLILYWYYIFIFILCLLKLIFMVIIIIIISILRYCCCCYFMKLDISKIRVTAFTRKTNVLYYTYKIWDLSITNMDTIKDLGVQLDSKLHFHAHADYIISQSVRMLGSNEL